MVKEVTIKGCPYKRQRTRITSFVSYLVSERDLGNKPTKSDLKNLDKLIKEFKSSVA